MIEKCAMWRKSKKFTLAEKDISIMRLTLKKFVKSCIHELFVKIERDECE